MSHENQIVTKGAEQSSAASLMRVPLPRVPITIRPATMDDLPFIDALQKKHTKMVGFMQTKALEGKIRAGHVLIAESDEATERRSDEGEEKDRIAASSAFPSVASSLRRSVAVPLGYLIGNDQYFKRDDVGIIYQINIVEGKRRSLVGATLLKAQFDRSAYGCRLYCCWCAQDLPANHFWESMGFVPLAFRTGSDKKDRTHIFWQKRIRSGDEITPWWFPSQTAGGSIREDRLVFPIPPGKRWSDEMPRILPADKGAESHDPQAGSPSPKQLPGTRSKKTPVPQAPTRRFVQFGRMTLDAEPARARVPAKPKPEKKPKRKNDPKLIAAARELRDRWLERVNADPTSLPIATTKYQVCKTSTSSVQGTLEAPHATPTPLLKAA